MTVKPPAELFSLKGRTALVTGASKGIGRELARGLALAGADVVIASRSKAELDEALEYILDGTSSQGACIEADLSRREEAVRTAAEALEAFGRIDVLVSNAGRNLQEPIDQITYEAWDEVIGTHLTTGMILTRELVPQMKERGWGRLIYTASILGFQGLQAREAYSAAKAGVMGFCRSVANDVGPFGITANCIVPGAIATEAIKKYGSGPAAARSPLERVAEPEELVGPLLLLASDAGSFITGTSLVVDGGWLVK